MQRNFARGHTQTVIDSAITLDGRLIATLGRDQVIRFWTLGDHYPLADSRKVAAKSAKGLALSGDGALLAAGDKNGNVQLWRLGANDPPRLFRGHLQEVWALAFSHGGEYLARGDRSGKIRIWHANNGKLVGEINTGSDAIWSLVFSLDGKALYALNDNNITLWTLPEGKSRAVFEHTQKGLTRMAFDPEQTRMLSTSSSGLVSIWDLATGTQIKTLKADTDVIWSAAFSPDAQQVAVASGNESVIMLDIKSGDTVAKLTGHTGGATHVAYRADQLNLVATDRDGAMHWWGLNTHRRLAAPWRGHNRAIWRMVVHPDGYSVASSSDDGSVKLWNTLSIGRACEMGFPSFDTQRRQPYFSDEIKMFACEGTV